MAKLSLADVARYSKTMNTEEMMANPDLQEYTSEMQKVGADVLENLSDEEIITALSFMSAVFAYKIMQDNPMFGMLIMTQPEEIVMPMMQSLRFAIGIMLSEEWR